MKNIYIFLLTIPLLALVSCGDSWLGKERPTTETEFKTDYKLTELYGHSLGLYDIVGHQNYYGGRMLYYGDVCGDDMQANGLTKRVSNAYGYRFTAENIPTSYWSYPYFLIRNTNQILRSIDDVVVVDEREELKRDHVKGQALALRALGYFDICRLFGYPYLKDNGASWGAPIVDPADKEPEAKMPRRNTVKETYDQVIIPDLLEAIPLLYNKRSETPGQVSRLTAKLLLARAYLYSGNWEGAFDYASQVVEEHKAAGFKMWTTEEYSGKEIWKSHARSESLLEIVFSVDDRQDNTGIGYLNYDKGYDDQILTDSFVKSWSSKDVRKNSYMRSKEKGNRPPSDKEGTNEFGLYRYFTIKYSAPSSNPRTGSVILIRVSEAHLIAAEAGVELGGEKMAKGLEYYNEIRTRAGLATKTVITTDDVLEERRFELYAEGHRSFDLLRRNRVIKRTGEGHYPQLIQESLNNVEIDWNNTNCILGIPQRELRSNSEIRDQQNPGW